MNYKDKLLDFVDGNLDVQEEQDLFSELTYNDSLRQDLKSYMSIDKSIKAGSASFAPSSAATNSVFATLGYSFPAEAPTATFASKAGAASGKVFSGIAGGIVGTFITLSVVLLFFRPSGQEELQPMPVPAAKIAVQSDNEKTPAISEIINSSTESDFRERKVTPTAMITENIATEEDNILPLESVSPLSSAEYICSVSPVELGVTKMCVSSDIEGPQVRNLAPSFSFFDNTGLSLEVKNHEAWHLPGQTISPLENPLFNHTGISLLYDLNDDFQIGAALRRENFYLEYQGSEADREFRYYQQPNFVSYSLLSRYHFARENFLAPFVQTEIGGNKYGYLGRMSVGAAINIYSNVALMLNLEGSLFMFQNSGQWFTAQKIGFEYGISYSF